MIITINIFKIHNLGDKLIRGVHLLKNVVQTNNLLGHNVATN